jgi:hypothetical protein
MFADAARASDSGSPHASAFAAGGVGVRTYPNAIKYRFAARFSVAASPQQG